jgi:hypothetical protein
VILERPDLIKALKLQQHNLRHRLRPRPLRQRRSQLHSQRLQSLASLVPTAPMAKTAQ